MDKLTNSEYKGIRVLQESAQGLNNSQISEKMFLSVSSVEKYLAEVRALLKAKSTVNAVYIAIQKGLIVMILCNISIDDDSMQRCARRARRSRRRSDCVSASVIVAKKNFQGINLVT